MTQGVPGYSDKGQFDPAPGPAGEDQSAPTDWQPIPSPDELLASGGFLPYRSDVPALLEDEARQHGRTQGRLNVARGTLKAILKRVEDRNDSISYEIAASARFGLQHSKPPEDPGGPQ